MEEPLRQFFIFIRTKYENVYTIENRQLIAYGDYSNSINLRTEIPHYILSDIWNFCIIEIFFVYLWFLAEPLTIFFGTLVEKH
jgi:hypothetical protein